MSGDIDFEKIEFRNLAIRPLPFLGMGMNLSYGVNAWDAGDTSIQAKSNCYYVKYSFGSRKFYCPLSCR